MMSFILNVSALRLLQFVLIHSTILPQTIDEIRQFQNMCVSVSRCSSQKEHLFVVFYPYFIEERISSQNSMEDSILKPFQFGVLRNCIEMNIHVYTFSQLI